MIPKLVRNKCKEDAIWWKSSKNSLRNDKCIKLKNRINFKNYLNCWYDIILTFENLNYWFIIKIRVKCKIKNKTINLSIHKNQTGSPVKQYMKASI
jgi:hypothetical protein